VIPRPERIELEGGARIVVASNPASPFLSFQGSLPAGVTAERPGEGGIAGFLSRLLLSGTRTRTARQLAETLEGLGATLEFDIAQEALVFHGRCTRGTAAKVFGIVADCLANPVLPAKEVERIRTEVLTEIEEDMDDTQTQAVRELLSSVYPPGHPYGRDPKGDAERVKAIEPGLLLELHDRLYGQQGMILALAGDVDTTFVRTAIAKPLDALPTGNAPAASPPNPGPVPPVTKTVALPHKSQVDIAIGLQAVPRSHPDFYAASLANLVFGVIGMYGRLGANVREEKGLAYYSLSRLRALRHGGHWYILAGVSPDRLGAAMAAIAHELDRLRTEPFTDDEIESAKLNQIGGLAVRLDRNAEVANTFHDIEFHGLGLDFLERYPGIVKALTRDATIAAAERYFRKRDCSVAIAGPIPGEVPSL